MILPTVNVELFSVALREFAKEVGAGTDKRVMLVVDKEPGGTRGRRWRCQRGYTWSFSPRFA
jgi:hypothetical protein